MALTLSGWRESSVLEWKRRAERGIVPDGRMTVGAVALITQRARGHVRRAGAAESAGR